MIPKDLNISVCEEIFYRKEKNKKHLIKRKIDLPVNPNIIFPERKNSFGFILSINSPPVISCVTILVFILPSFKTIYMIYFNSLIFLQKGLTMIKIESENSLLIICPDKPGVFCRTGSCNQCGECCLKGMIPEAHPSLEFDENGICVYLKKKGDIYDCEIHKDKPKTCFQYPISPFGQLDKKCSYSWYHIDKEIIEITDRIKDGDSR